MPIDKIAITDLDSHTMPELIPDPFIILRSDGLVMNANTGFANLIGLSKDQVIGKDMKDIPLLKDIAKNISRALTSGSQDFDNISFQNRNFEILTLPFRQENDYWLVRIILKDISTFVRLEKELLKRNKELIITNTLSSAFISSENMDFVMEDLIEKVLLITDFHTGWLIMNESSCLRLKASRGISPDMTMHIAGGGIDALCNDALKIRDPLYIVEHAALANMPQFREEGISFLLVIPLISNFQALGLLFLASRVERDLDFDFAALLSLVGNHVSHIIDKIKLFQETRRLSITDGLTGLYNSRHFYENLDLEIARTKRYGNSFSLILIDIDDFKKLNDTYGHQAGDEVLRGLAHILRSVSRETDIVARFGGEEFIMILPNTSEEEAFALAERLIKAVQQTWIAITATENVNITVSGGLASYPQNASSSKALINAADNAMYAAKAAGKNTVMCYQGKIHEANI